MDYHINGFAFFLNLSGIVGFDFVINITIAIVFETSGYKMWGWWVLTVSYTLFPHCFGISKKLKPTLSKVGKN